MLTRSRPRSLTGLLAALGVLLLTATPTAALPPSATSARAAADDLTWGVRPADNDLGAQRPHFAYEADPGDVVQDALVVTNHSTTELRLQVYAADAFTTSSGQLDLLAAGQTSTDVGTWVKLDDTELLLGPGESSDVPFTVTVPDDARPGDHAGGVVTSFRTEEPGSTVTLDRRLGSRMFVRVSGEATTSVDVTDVTVVHHASWNPFAPSQTTVRYTVSNPGNVRVAAADRAHVTGPFGWGDRQSELVALPELLPGETSQRQVEVISWPLVRLTADVDVLAQGVGLGGSPIAPVRVSAGTWALPWTLLALVVLVIGLGVLAPRKLESRAQARSVPRSTATDSDPAAAAPAPTEAAPAAAPEDLAAALERARAEGRAQALRELDAGTGDRPAATAPHENPPADRRAP